MTDIIVKSKIKKLVDGLRVSNDLSAALNKKIEEILKRAAERARANKRTTVMAQDL